MSSTSMCKRIVTDIAKNHFKEYPDEVFLTKIGINPDHEKIKAKVRYGNDWYSAEISSPYNKGLTSSKFGKI